MTASELIGHLESGGLIARGGDPSRIQFLRFEIYETSAGLQKYLGVYGWASALTQPENVLKEVMINPHLFVKVEEGGTPSETEDNARKAFEQIGHYDSKEKWKWVLTAKDQRKVNGK